MGAHRAFTCICTVPVSSAICTSGTWQWAVIPLLLLPELLSFMMAGISLLISITNQLYEHLLVDFLKINMWQFYLHTALPVTLESTDQCVSSATTVCCLWAAAPATPAAAIHGEPAWSEEQLCACQSQSWAPVLETWQDTNLFWRAWPALLISSCAATGAVQQWFCEETYELYLPLPCASSCLNSRSNRAGWETSGRLETLGLEMGSREREG